MKIVVLEKQVPDSTEITVDKKTGALIRDGVPAITNPDDLAGLEAALELKDKNPDTEVVVMTMGLPKAAEMLKEGVAMGAYEEEEPILVENIFHLADMNAGDIMTPRTQLKWIDLNGTEDEIMEVLKNANHYRIPVGTDSLDELKGLVTVSDVLVQIMQRPSESSIHDIIKACLKEPVLVPESISLMKLLNVLRTEGVHEAIILDEYGGFTGLVTLHDIMEEIVGLMPSGEEEIKEEENKIIERDGAWLVDGLLNVDEFKEFFHIDQELPGEEDDLYKTMGGLLNVLFGRIPKELDKAKWNGYTFEVIDMDHTRIDKILVTYEEPIVEQEEEK